MGLFNSLKDENDVIKENYKPKNQYKPSNKKGTIDSIVSRNGEPEWIIVNVDGNGERVKYNREKHSEVKIGDTLVIN